MPIASSPSPSRFAGPSLSPRAYGIHTFLMYLSMSYEPSNVESSGHRHQPIPAGRHRLGAGRLVVAVPAAQPGDNPGHPRQGPRRGPGFPTPALPSHDPPHPPTPPTALPL